MTANGGVAVEEDVLDPLAPDEDEDLGCTYPTSVWLDPGETTGWCVVTVHPHALSCADVPVLSNVTYWETGEFYGDEHAVIAQCVELAAAWPDAAVGAEDFILRRFGMERAGLSPVRITAAVEFVVRARGRQVFKQQPSMAKTAVTDERLKAWGFYRTEGGQVHARDATRHALTWLRRVSATDRRAARLRAAAWPYHYVGRGPHLGAYAGDFDAEACVSGDCRCAQVLSIS